MEQVIRDTFAFVCIKAVVNAGRGCKGITTGKRYAAKHGRNFETSITGTLTGFKAWTGE